MKAEGKRFASDSKTLEEVILEHEREQEERNKPKEAILAEVSIDTGDWDGEIDESV